MRSDINIVEEITEVLNVLVGGTCDKILGKFQAHCSSVVCIFVFYSLVKRFIVRLFTPLTCLEIMVGKMCSVPSLKVCAHAFFLSHALIEILTPCIQTRYLFLRWIVSEAERLHGDGSPQIRMRKSAARRRQRGKRERAMIPAYLPLLCTC